MSHWKIVNIYCTFLNTDTHSTKSQAPALVSFHWEGIKEMRLRGQILHFNKYLHPTHYINNMTFTIYNKRFVLKEEHFQWECLSFLLYFFCNGGIIVIVSAFVRFIVRNIIVLLVGWWLGPRLLCFRLVVLALLGKEEQILKERKVTFVAHRSSICEKLNCMEFKLNLLDISIFCSAQGRFLLKVMMSFHHSWAPSLLILCFSQASRGQHKSMPASRTCRELIPSILVSL